MRTWRPGPLDEGDFSSVWMSGKVKQGAGVRQDRSATGGDIPIDSGGRECDDCAGVAMTIFDRPLRAEFRAACGGAVVGRLGDRAKPQAAVKQALNNRMIMPPTNLSQCVLVDRFAARCPRAALADSLCPGLGSTFCVAGVHARRRSCASSMPRVGRWGRISSQKRRPSWA